MKERLDVLLVQNGYFPSREKAKAAIMAGEVFVDGIVFDKAGMSIPIDASITIKNDPCPYVSRGGLKLKKALDEFNISLNDLTCIDIGASTGGFTDCMLKEGASKVYAVDVGYGQLDYSLRENPQVVNIERCNFRYFDKRLLEEEIDFASIDVSFISLKHIFPICAEILKDNGTVCALVKPQFEAGKEQVGKKGIVKDPKIHIEVIENVIKYGAESGLNPINLTFSPITGAKGNIEYLLYLNKTAVIEYNIGAEYIERTILLSHNNLKKEI